MEFSSSLHERADTVAILLVGYARPDKTLGTLRKILLKVPQANVFVALDAAAEDANPKVIEHNLILQNELLTISSNADASITVLRPLHNLGTSQMIDWSMSIVFDSYNEVIVIEDDCLVAEDFLDFCLWALWHFRNNKQIRMIQGTNFMRWPLNSLRKSYLQYNLSHVWGWATWREKWIPISKALEQLNSSTRKDLRLLLGKQLPFRKYRAAWFELLNSNSPISWDLVLQWSIWHERHSVIQPGTNLVVNAGFDEFAHNSAPTSDHFQNYCGTLELPKLRRVPIPRFILVLLELLSFRIFAIVRLFREFETKTN